MDTEYIESVWWSLKPLHERGLLVRRPTRSPRTARGAAPALSDAEVALGYETVEDPSVFVRFPVVEAPDPTLVGASLARVDHHAVDAPVEHRAPPSTPDATYVDGRARTASG